MNWEFCALPFTVCNHQNITVEEPLKIHDLWLYSCGTIVKQKWCDRLIDACNLAPSGIARHNCHSEVGSSSSAQASGIWMVWLRRLQASKPWLMPLAFISSSGKNVIIGRILTKLFFFFQFETLCIDHSLPFLIWIYFINIWTAVSISAL